jgi:hypothetical protein
MITPARGIWKSVIEYVRERGMGNIVEERCSLFLD